MAEDQPTAEFTEPYVPFKTLLSFLERFEGKAAPPQIDRSLMKGMSGAYQSQLRGALRFLGLVDKGGLVQEPLREILRDPSVKKQVLARLVREKYAAALELSASNATQAQLEELFRKSGISGSTLRKAIGFFVAAAKFADVPLSDHFKKPRGGAVGPRRVRRGVRTSPGGGTTDVNEDNGDDALAPDIEALRTRYIEMLMEKAKGAEGQSDETMLDRIERLLGFESAAEGG